MTSRHIVIPAQAGIQWGEVVTGFPIGVGNDIYNRSRERHVWENGGMTPEHIVIPAQAGIQRGEAVTGFPIGVGNDMHDRMNEYYVYISESGTTCIHV